MLVVTRTPFRVSLFGGGTDLPAFFQRHGGSVLGAAIDRYCHLAVSDLPQCFDYSIRLAYSRLELVRSVNEIAHPVIRTCLEQEQISGGIEITHFADLPARTGLGTSSSFTAGLLLALAAMRGQRIEPPQLAAQSVHIERTLIGEAGGWQDQWFAAYGGLQRMDFSPQGVVSVRTVQLGPGVAEGLSRCLRLYYTGQTRNSSDVMSARAARESVNETTMLKMLRLVDEGQKVLESPWNAAALGNLLDRTWQLKRSLASGVSTSQVDNLLAVARDAGALGGKLLGAGGGGFLLLCVPEEQQSRVAAAIRGLFEVPFSIAPHGARVMYCDAATSS